MDPNNLPKCKCGSEGGLSLHGERWWCPVCLWAEIERLQRRENEVWDEVVRACGGGDWSECPTELIAKLVDERNDLQAIVERLQNERDHLQLFVRLLQDRLEAIQRFVAADVAEPPEADDV